MTLRKSVGAFKQKATDFVSWQVKQIGAEGAPALHRKMGKVVWGLLAVIPVILVRLIRPILWVRFGVLNSLRIGHFVFDTEIYLCERDVGFQNRKTIDFFGIDEFACNTQWKSMCERVLHVNNFSKHCYRMNGILPGGEAHTIRILSNERHGARDVHGLLRRTKQHVTFTDEEERRGLVSLREIGLPEGADFVCFHARDNAYLKTIYHQWDFSYHDYRDCDVQNYLVAAEKLASRGVFSLRMGAVVANKLNSSNSMVIDYANKGRTEFLDIYLSSRCRFFLASCSGIDSVAQIFRRPVVFANLIPLEYAPSWDSQFLIIPKKIWLAREQRFLGFREILETGVGRYLESGQYMKDGLEIVQNTADEIADVALEMDSRLRGSWRSTDEDEELQKRFWALFKPSHLHRRFKARIGAAFLQKNRSLLE